MGNLAELSVMQSRALFYDAVMGGKVYGVAAQAGITTQAGLSATTPALTLYNPAGSGKNLVIWYCGATFTVAFTAAAVVYVALNTNAAAAAVTGTLSTAHRNLKAGTAADCVAQPLLAATLPAAPIGISVLGSGLTGAITTVPQIQILERWYHGSIILTPNTALSIQTSTASGTTATFCEYIWEETPA